MADSGDKIQKGDSVVVVMARNDVFPWQSSPRFEATYVYGPSGPGDVFIFDVPPKLEQFKPPFDGARVEINGNSQEFVGFYRTRGRGTGGEA